MSWLDAEGDHAENYSKKNHQRSARHTVGPYINARAVGQSAEKDVGEDSIYRPSSEAPVGCRAGRGMILGGSLVWVEQRSSILADREKRNFCKWKEI